MRVHYLMYTVYVDRQFLEIDTSYLKPCVSLSSVDGFSIIKKENIAC